MRSTRASARSTFRTETERLGELARQWDIFIMAQAKARHEEFPGRYFNVRTSSTRRAR